VRFFYEWGGSGAGRIKMGPGRIGGSPTRHLDPPPEGTQTTPARVIGTGQAYDGWVEIDAHGWDPGLDTLEERRQFCVWIEYDAEAFPSFGSCLGAGEIDQPIAIESAPSLIQPRRLRYTEFAGALSPEVARVVISFRRPGKKKMFRASATVAQVSGGLQQELKRSTPFGYFVAKIRGLVRIKDARALAFNSAGNLVGSTRGLAGQGISVIVPQA
jgi:hypothetical protein